MKIACLGDVHGNLPALHAVLEHAARQGATAVWNVGDFVGYGPFPQEVIQCLRAIGAVSIRGNYDRKTLQIPQKASKWQQTKDPEKLLAFQWAYDHLSAESRLYLETLPEKLLLKTQDWKILLVHGSPQDPGEHLTPETPQAHLDALAQTTQADIILCGHSHRAFVRQSGPIWWINTGSVGRSEQGDPRTEYALLELKPQQRTVTHYRIEYDLEQTLQALRHNQLPETFARMFAEGHDYNWVKQHPYSTLPDSF